MLLKPIPFGSSLGADELAPNAVVDDRELYHVAIAVRANLELASARARTQPVPNRILGQRLKQQIRHERATRRGIDRDRDPEAVLKAQLLNHDVALEQLDLALDRHLLLARVVQ